MRVDGPKSVNCTVIKNETRGLDAVCARSGSRHEIAAGGIRVMSGADSEMMRVTAAQLADSMRQKCQLSELSCDGMKIVMAEPPMEKRGDAFRALGEWLEAQDGALRTSGDLGTQLKDLECLAETTSSVHLDVADLSDCVFRTVNTGIHAAIKALGVDPRSHRWVIQGLGSIGSAVAMGLASNQWDFIYWDADVERAKLMGARLGGEAVGALDVTSMEGLWCWVPCAGGPVITKEESIRNLPQFICGGANYIIGEPEIAKQLHRNGCLVVPDVLTSAGAVIEGIGRYLGGQDAVEYSFEANARVCREVLHEALLHRRPPSLVIQEILAST